MGAAPPHLGLLDDDDHGDDGGGCRGLRNRGLDRSLRSPRQVEARR